MLTIESSEAPNLTYHAPTTLEAALGTLADGQASILAGGTDFYPALGTATPRGAVLDLTRIPELRGISQTVDGGWRIGATTTWSEIAAARLPPAFTALQQAAREVGAVQIQNAATIGGNLCNASPAADGVPPLLLLGAKVELVSPVARRRLPLADFLTGPRQTVRAPDEVLSAILIPTPPAGASAFLKLGSRKYLVISIVMVAALIETDGETISDARIAVGACAPVALRLAGLEHALRGQPVRALNAPDIVGAADLSPLTPIDDVRADASYRRSAAAELIRRALLIAGGLVNE